MRIHELHREQVVPRPPGETFAFFARARNLERITPPWLRFEVLTPEPITMLAAAFAICCVSSTGAEGVVALEPFNGIPNPLRKRPPPPPMTICELFDSRGNHRQRAPEGRRARSTWPLQRLEGRSAATNLMVMGHPPCARAIVHRRTGLPPIHALCRV